MSRFAAPGPGRDRVGAILAGRLARLVAATGVPRECTGEAVEGRVGEDGVGEESDPLGRHRDYW